MPWTAIVNPVAGRGRTQKLLPELERAASAAGIALHVSPEPGAPTKLARAATDDGHDLLACGGDGLVTEVAGVAADTGQRLAIVPTGAGNDFARVLGYDPKHPLRAFDVVANGRDAVAAVAKESYDAVLMDVLMPEMDGLQAAEAICRRWPRGTRPRLVALTAMAAPGDQERCLRAGFDDYMSKPIHLDELSDALTAAAGWRAIPKVL